VPNAVPIIYEFDENMRYLRDFVLMEEGTERNLESLLGELDPIPAVESESEDDMKA
jgi:hypothetical protein